MLNFIGIRKDFLLLMFHFSISRFTLNNGKACPKLLKKPWGSQVLPSSVQAVFMSRFLKGKRGKAKFNNAHEAFKNVSFLYITIHFKQWKGVSKTSEEAVGFTSSTL